MQPRKMILGVLVGGPVLGLLMGLAVDPAMTAPPPSPWAAMKPDPIFAEPRSEAPPRYVAASLEDRTPTWDRRPAAEPQPVAYMPMERMLTERMPSDKAEERTLRQLVSAAPAKPLDEAAASAHPEQDANTGPAAQSQPALAEPDPSAPIVLPIAPGTS